MGGRGEGVGQKGMGRKERRKRYLKPLNVCVCVHTRDTGAMVY